MQRAAAFEAAWAHVGELLKSLSADAISMSKDRAVLWTTEKRSHSRQVWRDGHPHNETSHSWWVMLYVPGFSAHTDMMSAIQMGLGEAANRMV